ncbi:thioester reductase domain-containing protein [Comamonas sp. GB3 AK4-5]|uniref:thioester reductase domain-containing protein n=1 Tax=Comamonas sp. GB3 AK4-5 TaxID=3231487 RepID=UPI00351F7C8C
MPAEELNAARSLERTVLITGATGFVGAHLLVELAKIAGIGRIYVLLRRSGRQLDLESKLALSFNRFELVPLQPSPRIVIVEADLALPTLGLSTATQSMLANEVDTIYHVGAQVNHLLPYSELRTSNVESTAQLARLSLQGRPKVLNFVSTLGAAARRTPQGLLAEDFPDDTPLESSMGYFQSKWASERLLARVHASGYPANIFRLGRITGHSVTGVSLHQDNQLFMLIKGCIQLGAAPMMERLINMTPVDTISRLMAAPEFLGTGGQVFNAFNGAELVSWREIIDWLAAQGYVMEQMPFSSWQRRLDAIAEDNAIYKFLPLYRKDDAEHRVLSSAINIDQYESKFAMRAMSRNGIAYEKRKGELLTTYFEYLWRSGFLTHPAER